MNIYPGKRSTTIDSVYYVDAIDDSTGQNSIPVNLSTTVNASPFQSLLTHTPTPLIGLNSSYGLSTLRNVTDVDGVTGSITSVASEYVLSSGADANGYAILESACRGRYQAGFASNVGVGIRAPNTPSGSQFIRFGYYDDNDGFGFGYDATDWYVFVRKNGTDTTTYRSLWDDPLDGTGPSGFTLNLSNGHIFRIDFVWYGYGGVDYSVLLCDQRKTVNVLKICNPNTGTTVNTPNLPIRAEVQNGGTASDLTVYVAGRQYSINGPYLPERRIVSQYASFSNTLGTTPIPLVSFRRRNGSLYRGVTIALASIEVNADNTILVSVFQNPTLTGASFAVPSLHSSTSTASEVDTSATALTGGDLIFQTYVTTTNSRDKAFSRANPLGVDLLREFPLTVAISRPTGSGATDVSALVRVNEEA